LKSGDVSRDVTLVLASYEEAGQFHGDTSHTIFTTCQANSSPACRIPVLGPSFQANLEMRERKITICLVLYKGLQDDGRISGALFRLKGNMAKFEIDEAHSRILI
jgi:hypothetical protein